MEVAPDGMYLKDQLEEVIEHCCREIRDNANLLRMVASDWIAIPEVVSLDEGQASRIFAAVGAWNQLKVAVREVFEFKNAFGKPGSVCRPEE